MCEADSFPTPVATQVISIVTAGGTDGKGLFYPNGLNGVINGSSASAAALSGDIAGRRKLQVSAVLLRRCSSCVVLSTAFANLGAPCLRTPRRTALLA